eukprot:TRINITY_DN10935_c0_g1_i2.p1 TRINITY_DN10935_c0_g1~~TRINITY_DN10935_c0_g1_i2.p1  ORF type:complete len:113 (+),score=1.18 TRINITY_DN10935_c0_g1_i2:63-401(+)
MLRHIGAVCLAACAAVPGVRGAAPSGAYYPDGTAVSPFPRSCADISYTPQRECSCDSMIRSHFPPSGPGFRPRPVGFPTSAWKRGRVLYSNCQIIAFQKSVAYKPRRDVYNL